MDHDYQRSTACAICGLELPAHAPADQKVRTFWVYWNSNVVIDEATLEREARRRDYIMLNAWHHPMIPKLKAVNPGLKVFCYKDASSTRSYDSNPNHSLLPTGVSYQYANTYRPGWFLTTQGGTRLQYSGYQGHWQMDVGNPDYQRMWAENVKAVKTLGFDGVLIDNLLWTPDTYHPGTFPARYGTVAEFQAAYRSFLSNVRPILSDAGLLMIGNLTDARRGADRWSSYMTHLDGAWDEWWLTFSNTNMLPEYSEGWSRVVNQIIANEAANKITMIQPHFTGTDPAAYLYSLASFLMGVGVDSKAAYSELGVTDGYGQPTPWHTEFDQDLGKPLGRYHDVGTSIYRRYFERGVVVVNARSNGSAPVSIPLGGTYRNRQGTHATMTALAGCRGAIYTS